MSTGARSRRMICGLLAWLAVCGITAWGGGLAAPARAASSHAKPHKHKHKHRRKPKPKPKPKPTPKPVTGLWRAPATLSQTGASVPVGAMGANGSAAAAWLRAGAAVVARSPAGGPFGKPAQVPGLSGPYLTVAVGPSGQVLVLDESLHADIASAGHAFAPVTIPSTSTGQQQQVSAAFLSDGTALVTWVNGFGVLEGAVKPASATSFQSLGPLQVSYADPALALAAGGSHAMLVWSEEQATINSVTSNLYARLWTGSAFGAPLKVDTDTVTTAAPLVSGETTQYFAPVAAIDPSGAGAVLALDDRAAVPPTCVAAPSACTFTFTNTLRAATLGAGASAFGPAQTLASGDAKQASGVIGSPAVAVDPSGGALGLWTAGSPVGLQSAAAAAGGGFGTPAPVGTAATPSAPSVTALGSGRALAAFVQGSQIVSTIHAAGAFAPAVTVAAGTGALSSLSLAGDGTGAALVTWLDGSTVRAALTGTTR